jgi:hypothetical protein
MMNAGKQRGSIPGAISIKRVTSAYANQNRPRALNGANAAANNFSHLGANQKEYSTNASSILSMNLKNQVKKVSYKNN